MTWKEELKKLKYNDRSCLENYGWWYKHSDVIDFIKSLLKEQRESCADKCFGFEGGSYHRQVRHKIRNAPEPVK